MSPRLGGKLSTVRPQYRVALMRLLSWRLVLLGVCAVVVSACASYGTLDVADGDCVELWNQTDDGLTVPSGTALRLLGEDEQDLGYGLCHLFWEGDDGSCRALTAEVWPDTQTWETDSGRQADTCQDFSIGRAVTLDQNGQLQLDE